MLTPEVPMPMIARCPAGTSSHGGWVRAQDPLPHGGRHYWEVTFFSSPLARSSRSQPGRWEGGVHPLKR